MSSLIALGYVSKAFGLKGGVSVKLFSDNGEALREGVSLTLRQGLVEKELKVKAVLPDHRLFFEGICDRNEAEALRGYEIWIERALLPVLSDEEFYLGDMLGAAVMLIDGTKVGEVVGFSSNNAQTLIEIKTSEGHVASIPLVKAIVKSIDCEGHVLIIDPPAGLLDA